MASAYCINLVTKTVLLLPVAPMMTQVKGC